MTLLQLDLKNIQDKCCKYLKQIWLGLACEQAFWGRGGKGKTASFQLHL